MPWYVYSPKLDVDNRQVLGIFPSTVKEIFFFFYLLQGRVMMEAAELADAVERLGEALANLRNDNFVYLSYTLATAIELLLHQQECLAQLGRVSGAEPPNAGLVPNVQTPNKPTKKRRTT
jgi:hypothetical protein